MILQRNKYTYVAFRECGASEHYIYWDNTHAWTYKVTATETKAHVVGF